LRFGYNPQAVFVARPRCALVVTAIIAAIGAVSAGVAFAQDDVDDLRAAREEARRDAAEAAAQLDALVAQDADLVEALDALDRHIAFHESRIRAVEAEIIAAEEQAAEAEAQAQALDADIEAIRVRLRERAIEAFVAPRTSSSDLDSDDLLQSTLRRSFLDQVVDDEYELVDQLRTAVAEQEAAEAAAAELIQLARSQREELAAAIAELDAARAEAGRLRSEVQVRIADWQVISDEIEQADQEIAAEIVRLEAEAARIAEENARLAEEAARQAEAERLAREQAALEAEEEQATPTDDSGADDDGSAEETAAAADDPDDDGSGDDDSGDQSDTDTDDDGGTGDDPAQDGDEGVTEPDGDGEEPPASAEFRITDRPVPGAISSPFGERVHPIFGTVRQHYGVDLNGATGEPIVAGATGVVLTAGWRTGYGNTVVISHGGGYTTLYAHMTDIAVTAGADVGGGDLIGWVGATGWTTGPHLHFEVRLDGGAVDPAMFF